MNELSFLTNGELAYLRIIAIQNKSEKVKQIEKEMKERGMKNYD